MNRLPPVDVRILVVDDNPEVLHGTARLLEKEGYAVCPAADGQAALKVVRKLRPDLVLLDRNLPDLDGLEVCRRIKQDAACLDVLVIIVSASHAQSDEQAEGLELGADGYITRPIANREMLARVDSYVRIGRLARSLRLQVEQHQKSAAAALNLMEDAMQARNELEMMNRELRREVAEREKAETSLLLHTAALAAAANGIIITDRAGIIQWVNPAFSQLTGYGSAEAIGRNPRDLLKSGRHGQEFYRGMWNRLLAGEVWHGEIVNRRKDGSLYDEEMTVTPMRDQHGAIAHFIAIKQDISARKRSEAELHASRRQLSALTNRLQAVREEEATRIAREIHDELGQQLTGLKMDLRWLEQGLEKIHDPRASQLLEKTMMATELVDESVRTVQRIAAELRPAILDKLGLEAALRRETGLFEQKTGITCRLMVPTGELRPTAPLGIACFRIFQEAMTNVARHAGATQMEVELKGGPEGLVLEVRDNGRGIPVAVAQGGGSLGLLGMRERAQALGGEVTIKPREGGGTVVRLCLPGSA